MGGSRGNLSLDSKTNHPFTITNKKKHTVPIAFTTVFSHLDSEFDIAGPRMSWLAVMFMQQTFHLFNEFRKFKHLGHQYQSIIYENITKSPPISKERVWWNIVF